LHRSSSVAPSACRARTSPRGFTRYQTRSSKGKALFSANLGVLASLRGDLSNRDAAELLLGDRFKEGTIRSWKDATDEKRYPRKEERDRLNVLIQEALRARTEGAFR
jgi:hypothetical protein